jgi:ABC-2 type transport system ATP-binding protein
MTAIELTDLSKDFGSVRALNGVNLTDEMGEIFGFLGPNGADL